MFIPCIYLYFLIYSGSCQKSTNNTQSEVLPNPPNFNLTFDTTSNNFTIGGIFSIQNRTTGELIEDGVQNVEAFRCAIESWNSRSSQLPNITLLYNIQDDGGESDTSLLAGTELIRNNRIMATVGPFTDDAVQKDGLLYSLFNAPLISPSSTSTLIPDNSTFTSFLRTTPSDTFEARSLASTAKLLSWDFVAALFTDDELGISGQQAFRNAASRSRIRITCLNTIAAGTTRGISSFANCVAQSDASVVVLWMGPEDAANVINALYNLNDGVNRRVTFMASFSWFNFLLQDPVKFSTDGGFPLSMLTGTIGTYPFTGQESQFRACWSSTTPATANYTAFTKFWQDKFRCYLPNNDPVVNPAPVNDGVNTSTLPLCPVDVALRNTACLCNGGETLSSDSNIFSWIRTNFVIDAVGVIANALDFVTRRCEDIELFDACNLPNGILTSRELYLAISELNYRGNTGGVSFIGTDRRSGSYNIFQMNESGKEIIIGTFNSSTTLIQSTLLTFKTPEIPISTILPDEPTVDDNTAVLIMAILCAIMMFVCILMAIYFLIHINNRVVIKSNIIYILALIVGSFLLYACMFVWSFSASNFICNIRIYLGVIGLSMILGALLAKSLRYLAIYSGARKQSNSISASTVLLGIAIVLLGNALIAFIYLIIANANFERVNFQSTTSSLYFFISCRAPSKSAEYFNIFRIIFACFNLYILVIISFAFICSKFLDTAYKELRYASLAIFNFTIVGILVSALYLTTGDGIGTAQSEFLLRTVVLFVVLLATLILIFFPKFTRIRKLGPAGEVTSSSQGSVSRTRIRELSRIEPNDASAPNRRRFLSSTVLAPEEVSSNFPPKAATAN